MRTLRGLFALLALSVALVGCNKDENQGLTGENLAGDWLLAASTTNGQAGESTSAAGFYMFHFSADGNFAYYDLKTTLQNQKKQSGTFELSGDRMVLHWPTGNLSERVTLSGENLTFSDFPASMNMSVSSLRYRKISNGDQVLQQANVQR